MGRSKFSRSALSMKASNIVKEGRSPEAPSGWGTRHTIVVVAALGNLLGYFLRVDMSVAIVAMVDQSNDNSSLYGEECPSENTTSPETQGGTFQWDQSQQGLIPSGYSMGFITTNYIGGGLLTERYGSSRACCR